jgi:hypothetical protein
MFIFKAHGDDATHWLIAGRKSPSNREISDSGTRTILPTL